MIIISWLRSFGIKTNLERLMFGNFQGKSFSRIILDFEEWVMVKIRGAMSKLHGKIKALG